MATSQLVLYYLLGNIFSFRQLSNRATVKDFAEAKANSVCVIV